MVTIKVRSAEDIAKAYLLNLGFEKKSLNDVLPLISEKVGNEKDIIKYLDGVLLKKATSVFDRKDLSKEQLVALFKFCFLNAKDAKKFGKEVFGEGELSEEFVVEMQSHVPSVTPKAMSSKMKIQPIEQHTPKSLLKKFWEKIYAK